MIAVLRLAALSAWNRRLTLGLVALAVSLATCLLLSVERLRSDARLSFFQSVSGVDLVVGPRGGELPLLLHAVFRSGNLPTLMSWSSYRAIADHPAVAWAVPLALGDSHRGFPVLGTDAAYFTHYRTGDDAPLRFSAGGPFSGLFEAVVGSEVASRLGYRPGQAIVLGHGHPHPEAERVQDGHDDKPFRVVGVLQPTGTPADRTVHVSLQAIAALHLEWVGGSRLPGVSIPPAHVARFDLQPREISALLVGLKRRSDALSMQRFVNGYRDEPLQAVLPAVALDELWRLLGILERTLLLASFLVVVTGLTGLAATLLAGLNERRRELAILRALGAGPRDVFLMLTAEGVLVTALGTVVGLLLLALASEMAAPWLLERFGVVLASRWPAGGELELLGLVLATGLLASLVPGWRAWRMSLADGLTPRL